MRFDCPECGKSLSCAERMVGKKAPCRFCGAAIRIPLNEDAEQDSAEVDQAPDPFIAWCQRMGSGVVAGLGAGWRASIGAVAAWREKRRTALSLAPTLRAEVVPVELVGTLEDLAPCPFCDELIRKAAKKCKHCGEILDLALRQAMQAPQRAVGPAPAPSTVTQSTVTHVYHAPPVRRWSRGVAIVLSFLVPGLGQMYKGQIFNGLVWLVFTTGGYFALILPGVLLHVCCLIGAASGDETQ